MVFTTTESRTLAHNFAKQIVAALITETLPVVNPRVAIGNNFSWDLDVAQEKIEASFKLAGARASHGEGCVDFKYPATSTYSVYVPWAAYAA